MAWGGVTHGRSLTTEDQVSQPTCCSLQTTSPRSQHRPVRAIMPSLQPTRCMLTVNKSDEMTTTNRRPLSLSERYSVTRTLVGSSPLPTVVATFALPSSSALRAGRADLIRGRVHSALAGLLLAFPVLCAHFEGVRSDAPDVVLAEVASVREVLDDLVLLDTTSHKHGLDKVLTRQFEALSGADLIESVEASARQQLPPWRIVIWVPTDHTDETSVAFIAHHAMFDGISTLAVAQSLVEFLTGSGTPGLDHSREFGQLPGSLESHISTAPSYLSLARTIVSELVIPALPSILRRLLQPDGVTSAHWTGTSSASSQPCSKRHRHLILPASLLDQIHAQSRNEKASVTSVLHAAIASAIDLELVQEVDSSLALVSSTAISLRSVLPSTVQLTDGKNQGAYFSAISCTLPPPAPNASPFPSSNLWSSALMHHTHVRSPSARQTALEQWGMLAFIPSSKDPLERGTSAAWERFFRGKMEKARAAGGGERASFELSNVGFVEVPASSDDPAAPPPGAREELEGQDGGRWRLKNLVFTQSPIPLGAALTFSVVGWGRRRPLATATEEEQQEGSLTISVGWEEGVIADEAVERTLARLERLLQEAVGR